MGANQSTPSDAVINEKLRERLQALNLNEERALSEKDGFMHVAGDARMLTVSVIYGQSSNYVPAPKYAPLTKHEKTISTRDAEEWEKKIMEDPKVRWLAHWHSKTIRIPKLEIESSCSPCTQLESSHSDSLLPRGHHLRHSSVQHQDTRGRIANHEPSFIRTMLAFCFYQRLPHRYHEEIQA